MKINLDSSNPAADNAGHSSGDMGDNSGYKPGCAPRHTAGTKTGGNTGSRQRVCDSLVVMPESEFRSLCDDTGITAAAYFDRTRSESGAAVSAN